MGMEEGSSNTTHCHDIDGASSASPLAVGQMLALLQSDDPHLRLQAATEIRRLTKTSQLYRRHFSPCVDSLVRMLGSGADEAVLAALLNLAVKDEINKVKIIEAGTLIPIICFLQSDNAALQELAVAALITLSASPAAKPVIAASGAIPPLVDILRHGARSQQAKLDSVMALYNLSTHPQNINLILRAGPIPPLIDLLRSCRRSSRTTEKCAALIESLVTLDEGRAVISSVEGGILKVVEVVEGGSLLGREHAVGALLVMCQSDRARYREPILEEGVVPGLLELTVQGTGRAQTRARTLLRLLRENPGLHDSRENNVVGLSMEHSLRQLQENNVPLK